MLEELTKEIEKLKEQINSRVPKTEDDQADIEELRFYLNALEITRSYFEIK